MVDVSVLTPVLNEEEHIREVAAKMLAQRFDGTIEFIFIDGDSEDRTAEILRELQRTDPRVRILQNPRRSTPVGLNIGLANARGAFIARMDAHTLYPEDYLARGVARLRRGGADHVSGPQLAHGDGTWSRRVALALDTPLGRGGAQFRAGLERRDRGRQRLHRRLAALGARGARRLGRGLAQRSGLRAGRPHPRGGGRILCLPEMSAKYIPRDSLKALARQYWRYGVYRAKTSGAHPESMRRSHLLAPSLALSLAAAILPLGACAGSDARPWRSGAPLVVGVAMAEAWRADTTVRARRNGRRRGRPPGGLRRDAPRVGLRLPVRLRPLRPAVTRAQRTGVAAPSVSGARPLRVAVYADNWYRPTADGIYADRSLVLFIAGVAAAAEHTILLGQLDPELPRAHYRVPDHVEFVGLPVLPEHAQPARPAGDAGLAAHVLAAAARRSTSSGCWGRTRSASRSPRSRRCGASASPWACARTSPPTCARATRAGGWCTWPATCSRAPTG